MFGWFWEFLYDISKTIFRLIDTLVECAHMLCGVEKITVDGKSTDLMTYLLNGENISFAFKTSALVATILLVVFTVFMIVRTVAKDKAEGTPIQICMKAFKTLLTFFFVPLLNTQTDSCACP